MFDLFVKAINNALFIIFRYSFDPRSKFYAFDFEVLVSERIVKWDSSSMSSFNKDQFVAWLFVSFIQGDFGMFLVSHVDRHCGGNILRELIHTADLYQG